METNKTFINERMKGASGEVKTSLVGNVKGEFPSNHIQLWRRVFMSSKINNKKIEMKIKKMESPLQISNYGIVLLCHQK